MHRNDGAGKQQGDRDLRCCHQQFDGRIPASTEVTKVDRGTLLSLGNPRYKGLLERYDHLKGVMKDDVDDEELPVHLILGTNEYAQIKTETRPKIGKPGEPIAELTR